MKNDRIELRVSTETKQEIEAVASSLGLSVSAYLLYLFQLAKGAKGVM